MITAIILMNVERELIKDVIEEILKIDGIMEVHSVAGEAVGLPYDFPKHCQSHSRSKS